MSKLIAEMKRIFEAEEKRIKESAGGIVIAAAGSGPAGIGVVKPIVSAVEQLAKEIEELKRQVADLKSICKK